MARRVDQVVSALGYGSRTEAAAWCRAGRGTLNGEVLRDASARVEPSLLRLDGAPLEFPDGLLVMLHKPAGVVCSHDTREGRRVYDLMPPRWLLRDPKVTTVGRLDKDTSGLLLVTDDGALVQRLTSPKHHVEKTYVANLDGPVTPAMVAQFAAGIPLKEGAAVETTLPATLRGLDETRAEVTLTEGRYHQVRRMFSAVGREVLALHRTRFGPWSLEALAEGQWIRVEPPAH